MKVLKILSFLLVLLAAGYGIYHFGTKIASDKLISALTTELEASGELERIKQHIENNSELKNFLSEGANIDDRTLPFNSKEDAVKVLFQRFDISEINTIQKEFQNGFTAESQENVLSIVQEKLTEEEILALKVIAYRELYN